MTTRLVLHRALVDGELVDVTCAGERIESVTPVARRPRGGEVLDVGGGALLPGLHDHHLHLLAMAAARRSVEVGPPAVTDAAGLGAALHAAAAVAPPGAWLRAIGYHESVAGELDGARLDELAPLERPVRVQHRSGACWTLNGAAARAIALDTAAGVAGIERAADGAPSGRLFGLDDWLRDRVPSVAADLAAVGAELASYGITGVTDATPTERADEVALLAAAALPLRIVVTGGPGLAAGAASSLPRGPVKLVVADHRLPAVEELASQMRAARRLGRAVAVHCVTRIGLVVALAAWDEVGAVAGDRVEHGAVVPLELAAELSARGLTVVTQPGFVRARGDAYLDEVEPLDRGDLWRCASLVAAGVGIAGSSDAPFGPADPWLSMAAAVDRTTTGGRCVGAAEALTPAAALGLYLGAHDDPARRARSRRDEPGAPADLCVLACPIAEVLGDLDARHVVATVVGGRLSYRR